MIYVYITLLMDTGIVTIVSTSGINHGVPLWRTRDATRDVCTPGIAYAWADGHCVCRGSFHHVPGPEQYHRHPGTLAETTGHPPRQHRRHLHGERLGILHCIHRYSKSWWVIARFFCAWVRQPTGRLGVSINGLSDSFLLSCGGIESVAWHLKNVGRRSFGPNKTGPH